MKRYRWSDFSNVTEGHIFHEVMPGDRIYQGGFSASRPTREDFQREHNGKMHKNAHDDFEAFIVLQGQGEIEVNQVSSKLTVGDIIIVEPGEDHQLFSDPETPLVTVYLHTGLK